jgi:WD40 repeat protein
MELAMWEVHQLVQSLDMLVNLPICMHDLIYANLLKVTYVETTNAFLLVGSTSGTVYLFSRDNLGFILMIPFKGGRVCNIAMTPDESQVAVASIRGKVSIYRIFLNNNLSRSVSSNIETFKHLFDVPHHINNEITEMKWSPNGKFLFVGDSQGIISQIDV